MKNVVYNEDCRETLQRIFKYHYVLTGFPDLSELGNIPPSEYKDFAYSVLSKLKPANNVITIQSTDRKKGGIIIQKHLMFTEIMASLGWKLISQKIWVKSYKINLFRLEYSFFLTFQKGKIPFLTKPMPDVYYVNKNLVYTKTAKGAFPKDIAVDFIRNYTRKGEMVYDPFMGSGVTAFVALVTERGYCGSELDKDIYGNFKIEEERRWGLK